MFYVTKNVERERVEEIANASSCLDNFKVNLSAHPMILELGSKLVNSKEVSGYLVDSGNLCLEK